MPKRVKVIKKPTENRGRCRPAKEILFVVDEPSVRDNYGFLEPHFDVLHSDSFDVIGRLLAASPDAILFKSCLPDAEMILQVLTGHPILQGTPVIEVQTGKPKTFGGFFASLSFPLDEDAVFETLDRATEAKRISRILREGEFSGPFKTGISILLVDDSSASEAYDLEDLRGLDCDAKRISNLKLLYDSFAWSTPDVIAIDEGTREVDARTVCRLLNMNRELKDVPKLLLSQKKGTWHNPVRPLLFSADETVHRETTAQRSPLSSESDLQIEAQDQILVQNPPRRPSLSLRSRTGTEITLGQQTLPVNVRPSRRGLLFLRKPLPALPIFLHEGDQKCVNIP